MQLGMIGLGRMGANMVRRLLKGGHQCVVFDRSPKAVEELVAGEGDGSRRPAGSREEAGKAAGDLADGPGGSGRQDHRRPRAAPRAGRHPHRRRQLLLRGRHPARQGTRAEGHPLRGCGHQRRRLGPGARLLHDDRRRDGSGQTSRSDLRNAGAGRGRYPAHAGAREARRHRRTGLPALRPERRRPLRQDGPQRHRVRPDGRLRRGTGRSARRQCRQAARHGRRGDHAAARSRALSVRSQSSRHRRGVAARQRDRFLAARPDGGQLWSKIPLFRNSPGASRIRAKGGGPSRPPSTKACRCRFSPPRSTSASARAARRTIQDKLLSAMRFQFGGHLEKPAGKQAA